MIYFQDEMIRKLKKDNRISYSEICDITYSFQIASGQGYAIGKTKGILDFLNRYGNIDIVEIPNTEELCIKTNTDLANFNLSLDKDIDLEKDSAFSEYFK